MGCPDIRTPQYRDRCKHCPVTGCFYRSCYQRIYGNFGLFCGTAALCNLLDDRRYCGALKTAQQTLNKSSERDEQGGRIESVNNEVTHLTSRRTCTDLTSSTTVVSARRIVPKVRRPIEEDRQRAQLVECKWANTTRSRRHGMYEKQPQRRPDQTGRYGIGNGNVFRGGGRRRIQRNSVDSRMVTAPPVTADMKPAPATKK